MEYHHIYYCLKNKLFSLEGLLRHFFSCWGANELCIIVRGPTADREKMKDGRLQSTKALFTLSVTKIHERRLGSLRGQTRLLKWVQKDPGDNEFLAVWRDQLRCNGPAGSLGSPNEGFRAVGCGEGAGR